MPSDKRMRRLFERVVKKLESNSSGIKKEKQEKQEKQERKRSYCERYARTLKKYINDTIMKYIVNCDELELDKKRTFYDECIVDYDIYESADTWKRESFPIEVLVTKNDIQVLLQ